MANDVPLNINIKATGLNDIARIEKALKDLGIEAKAAAAKTKDSADEMKQAGVNTRKFEKDIRTLTERVKQLPKDLARTNNEMRKLADAGKTGSAEYQALTVKLRRLTDEQRKLSAANEGSTKGFGQLRSQVQNASFQFTDFVVSIQNGTSAATAFTQQFPQLAGAFGAAGALIGLVGSLAGALAGPFINSMLDSLDPMRAFEKAAKGVDEAVDRMGRGVNEVDLSGFVARIREAQSELNGLSLPVEALLSQKALSDARDAARKIYEAFSDEYTSVLVSSSLDDLTIARTLGTSVTEIKNLKAEIAAGGGDLSFINALISGLDESSDEYDEILQFLLKIRDAQETVTKVTKAQAEQARLIKAEEEGRLDQYIGERDALEEINNLITSENIKRAQISFYENMIASTTATEAQKEAAKELLSALQDKGGEDFAKRIRAIHDAADSDGAGLRKFNKDVEFLQGVVKGAGEEAAAAADALDAVFDSIVNADIAAQNKELRATANRIQAINDAADPEGAQTRRFAKDIAFLQVEIAKGGSSAEAAKQALIALRAQAAEGIEVKIDTRVDDFVQGLKDSLDPNGAALRQLNQTKTEIDAIIEFNPERKAELDKLKAGLQETFDLEYNRTPLDDLTDALGQGVVNAAQQAGQALTDFVIKGEKDFNALAGSILGDLARIIQQQLILIGLKAAAPGLFPAAKGAAFNSAGVIPFASGGIVTSPTLFSYGGGRTGIMGEAGAEAIMPLTRSSETGNLGVEAKVNVNVKNYGTQSVDVRQRDNEIDIIIGAVADQITKGGTQVARALEGAYGVSRGRSAY